MSPETAQLSFQKVQARAFSLSRLILTNFRNYKNVRLDIDSRPIIITGHNGSGKTNILEAVSLLSPGKGLRKIKLNEADRMDSSEASNLWAIAAFIKYGEEEIQLGTARETTFDNNKRVVKIDGNIIKNQAELTRAFSVMWLTPQMDGLFIGSSSDRRKFFDRLVYNFDPEHASRVYSYEYTMRERARLLKERRDPSWISVLENKMAEQAVAIAAARIDTISFIQKAILSSETAFPKAILAIEGQVEKMIENNSALQAEEGVRQKLFESRRHDAESGRTNFGTHRSDFLATHAEKNMPAELCSTGEQKALLLSIILAEAKAKAIWKNSVPVLLLDEVVSHLDEKKREFLFSYLIEIGSQFWLTGTDVDLFSELKNQAQFFTVDDARIF